MRLRLSMLAVAMDFYKKLIGSDSLVFREAKASRVFHLCN
jgi:hypothetical protein